MNKFYPISADSPYQKKRRRFKTLVSMLNTTGGRLSTKVYLLDQKFNRWERKHPSVWCHKTISSFNKGLQRALDSAEKALSEVDTELDKAMGVKTPKPSSFIK